MLFVYSNNSYKKKIIKKVYELHIKKNHKYFKCSYFKCSL